MNQYHGFSDDFYVNMNLSTEMELPGTRDTVLHYFDRLQKSYPEMRNFYCRDRNEFVLEEEKDRVHYRWATVELRRVSSGHVNPERLEDALKQHQLVLDLAPYLLSVSPMDCESLNVMFGFDFTYSRNQNQVVAEALGVVPAMERMTDIPGATIISHEPTIQLALDEDCRTQCRLSIETRTSAYHVRTGEYPEEQLSVYVAARRYGSLDSGESYVSAFDRLAQVCQDMVDNHIIDTILTPLQRAIALK